MKIEGISRITSEFFQGQLDFPYHVLYFQKLCKYKTFEIGIRQFYLLPLMLCRAHILSLNQRNVSSVNHSFSFGMNALFLPFLLTCRFHVNREAMCHWAPKTIFLRYPALWTVCPALTCHILILVVIQSVGVALVLLQ